jgi:hypothetical protein
MLPKYNDSEDWVKIDRYSTGISPFWGGGWFFSFGLYEESLRKSCDILAIALEPGLENTREATEGLATGRPRASGAFGDPSKLQSSGNPIP